VFLCTGWVSSGDGWFLFRGRFNPAWAKVCDSAAILSLVDSAYLYLELKCVEV